MKRLLTSLLCTALLAACSNSEDVNPKAVKPAETSPSAAAAAELRPENIAYYHEKVDSQKIRLALKKAGFDQGRKKEAEWNQRLEVAKTDADLKSVLNEQLDFYRRGQQALAKIEMNSEQGRTIRRHLLNGFAGTVPILEAVQPVDLTSAEGEVIMNEAMPKIHQYGQEIGLGLKLWMDMLKASDQPLDADTEKAFQEKMKEVEAKLKE